MAAISYEKESSAVVEGDRHALGDDVSTDPSNSLDLDSVWFEDDGEFPLEKI